MAPRTRSWRHAAIAFTAGAAALATTSAAIAGTAAGRPRGIDWNAVGRAIGQPLKTEAQDVHTAEWLRTDLHVVNAGVRENPAMELNAEASFHQTTPDRALMIGEVTLTGAEVNKVADALQRGGVEITALHKHIQDETPRLWWMHYWAQGDPVQIARTVHTALAQTGIPLDQKEGKEPPVKLDTAALDRIIGAKGEDENGVLQYRIPVTQKITDTRAHTTVPYLMEASTQLMFQPLGGGRAAVNGDFTMTADQVNPVIKALRSRGMTIIELHNHMLYEQPRLFYLHFWKTGDATALAGDLRAGLDQVRAPGH
ncbi:protein of unknown function [Thermomonospora echinospora]|uniref:DUF1259 domain-containing protein n=1 Tax=Thermomonospora echinospora TaxID=1992 RepID=A0A1H6C542_9ACTN|nr:DUF1259 domain-containing protein [Thermomonospora echinospora]SEG67476.1 protein of unknown function [Thermomonospora echinospora]